MSVSGYSAFLSYSRVDEVIGAWLEKAIQGYRIPRQFRPDRDQKRLKIFRDVHDAELGEYSEVIEKALRDSRYLILLCSPSSRASTYVAGEITAFIELHGSDKACMTA